MAAADRDRPILDSTGRDFYVPVAATTKIYAGTLVMADAAGRAIPADEVAGRRVLGIAQEQADNSSGGAGAINVKLRVRVAQWLGNTGLTIADRGKRIIVDDDQTVKAWAASGVLAGILLDVSATDGALVFVDGVAESTFGDDVAVTRDLAVGRDVSIVRSLLMAAGQAIVGAGALTLGVAAGAFDLALKMGDKLGVQGVLFKDSDGTTVAKIDSLGRMLIKRYSQADAPDHAALGNGLACFFHDTDDNKCYLVFDDAGTVKKVELT